MRTIHGVQWKHVQDGLERPLPAVPRRSLHVNCVPHAVIHPEMINLDPRELARLQGAVDGGPREAREQRERRQDDREERRGAAVGSVAWGGRRFVLPREGALVEDAGAIPAPAEFPPQQRRHPDHRCCRRKRRGRSGGLGRRWGLLIFRP